MIISNVQDLKIAIVNDSMYSPGGGDKLFFSICSLFPNADLYTLIFVPDRYSDNNRKIRSIISVNWFVKILLVTPILNWFFSRALNVLSPILYESVNLTQYDLVISTTARSAKGLITGLNTCHISIMNTPPRFEWDKDESIKDNKVGFGLGQLSHVVSTLFRIWDRFVVIRADYTVAISKFIAKKIQKYYRIKSDVIYPGIRQYWFEEIDKDLERRIYKDYKIDLYKRYFFFISRLYDNKRVDWLIKAVIDSAQNLVIIGDGPEFKRLKKLAGSELGKSIFILGYLEDNVAKVFYKNAEAFIFAAWEDFGMVPLEAMACGTPVIAYNGGGVLETIGISQYGTFFDKISDLTEILKVFQKNSFNSNDLKQFVLKYSEKEFQSKFLGYVSEKYNEFKEKNKRN